MVDIAAEHRQRPTGGGEHREYAETCEVDGQVEHMASPRPDGTADIVDCATRGLNQIN
jgi:hypothetical protein